MTAAAVGKIKQVAYITENLDASIQHWIDFAAIGPWQVYKNVVMTGRYKGVSTAVTMNVGLSYRDDLQIELIHVISKTPSPYQSADGRALVGMHHIAWFSEDLAADIKAAEKRGLTCVFEASNGASRVAYCASKAEPGLLFEYIAVTPAVAEGFAAGMAAAQGWDGISTPMHVIDFAAQG
jgi:hypothetical protein